MLSTLYRPNLSLLTDLYQLTMASGYWKRGLYNRKAVFHLFYRKNPFEGSFAVAAGLESAVDWLKNLRFEPEMIQYLGQLKGNDGRALFDEGFLNHLQRMRFSCDVEAVPEGTVVQPHMPLMRIEGPIIQAQLVETALLNIINFSTLIATKAARICQAAEGDSVIEFGLRRAQGIDGGLSATRAAFIGGCEATSNVLAGQLWNIPVKGTHAHSWVMAFDSELEAFEAYAQAMPNNTILLVDTYDTVEGVRKAIEVGRQLRRQGADLGGIRLDSGDLLALSRASRQLLDEAGFHGTRIVASNDLDEYAVRRLKAAGAPIDVWGIGTRLATAYDQPALGGVYKLAALQGPTGAWDYKIKLSEQQIKVSLPGSLQARRFRQPNGEQHYLLYNTLERPSATCSGLEWATQHARSFDFTQGEDLLVPIFKAGQLVYQSPPLDAIRQRTLQELQHKVETTGLYLEQSLFERRQALIEAANQKIEY